MQTEQFDDEFRKKLLRIAPVTDEDEVDRIYNYVASNGSNSPHFSWTKGFLYGLAASLLTASLTFNYVQNLTNKQLFTSLDSLKNRITSIDNQKSGKATLRVDTVYINRYIEKTVLPEIQQGSVYAKQTFFDPSEQPNHYPESNQPAQNQNLKAVDSLDIAANEAANLSGISFAENNVFARKTNNGRSENQITKKGFSETGFNENEPAISAANKYRSELPIVGSTKNSASDIPATAPTTAKQVKESRNWLFSELSRIGKIHQTLIDLQLPMIKQRERLLASSTDKPKYYAQSIKSIFKKMDYYIGGSFDAGSNQVGGSLLGELRITPKWSFQTGVRWIQIFGDNYYTAEQYSQQTGDDFRSLYAPYIAQNVDLLNIEQNYQLVQIPLTVAYHYELLPNWALRFGLGTNLSVYSQKHIHFDYKENSLSFDQGEYNAKLAVKPFNDLTINLGLEHRWNKFLFRVSPYVSLQLHKTEFSKEDLSWGARVQVLYKFK